MSLTGKTNSLSILTKIDTVGATCGRQDQISFKATIGRPLQNPFHERHNILILQNRKNIHQSVTKLPTLAQKSAKIVRFV